MIKNLDNKRSGFTLVELVIVIALLGILSSLAIVRWGQHRTTAKIVAHNGNVRIIKSAATTYLAEHPDITEIPRDDLKNYFDGDDLPGIPGGLSDYKDNEGNLVSGEYSVILDASTNVYIVPGEIPR